MGFGAHNYFYNSPEQTDAVGFPPTSFQHAIQEEVLRQRKPKDHDTLVPRLPVYMAGQPTLATYPYGQRLCKPIGFPKKKAGDMIHPAISGGENSSSPGSHIPTKLKACSKNPANFSGPVAKITSCPGLSQGRNHVLQGVPGISQFWCVFLGSSKCIHIMQLSYPNKYIP